MKRMIMGWAGGSMHDPWKTEEILEIASYQVRLALNDKQMPQGESAQQENATQTNATLTNATQTNGNAIQTNANAT